MARMEIDEGKNSYSLTCNDSEIQIAMLKVKCLDLCFKHDLRPAKGELASKDSLHARMQTAIEILKWAIAQ